MPGKFNEGGRRKIPKARIAIWPDYDSTLIRRGRLMVVSFCEHHMLPVIGRAHVGYLPTNRVVLFPSWRGWCTVLPVGCRSRRHTAEIAEAVQEILKPQCVGVLIEAEHSCMTYAASTHSDPR